MSQIKKLVAAALCTAMGLLFPSLFHLFGGTGPVFLPMHIPVLICGFLCGPQYGLLCGLIVPLLSSTTGMPVLFPTGISMMFELGVYGFCAGLFSKRLPVYPSLILAMLLGRAASGLSMALLMGMAGRPYGLAAFLTGAFVTAMPGIIIQLVFVPLLVTAVRRSGVLGRAAHA